VRTAIASALVVAFVVAAPDRGAPADSALPDSFGPSITLRTPDGWYAAPMHGTLLPDGRVFLVGLARETQPATDSTPTHGVTFVLTPSAPGAPAPSEMTIDPIAEPIQITSMISNGLEVRDDLFCSGQTLTADGRLFTAGGTRLYSDPATGGTKTVLGLAYETMFDGTTWSRLPGSMVAPAHLSVAARWYPTVTRLPSGKLLVTSGDDVLYPVGSVNLSTETYDPATGVRAVASPYGTVPTAIINRDYTDAFVLPTAAAPFDLLMLGENDTPVLNSTQTPSSWKVLSIQRPGTTASSASGVGQTAVMLPVRLKNGEWGYGNGSILVTGGTFGSAQMSRADVFDPSAIAWHAPVETGTTRHHPAAVALPDGRILIITGHNMTGDLGVLHAQYVDPRTGFSVQTGASAMTEMRGYHTVALLLPDGRVLLAGGRDANTSSSLEKPTLQYYSPDYIGKPRPQILSAPSQIAYKGLFAVQTTGPAPTDVELVGLGSMTHSFDMNQRVVQVPVGAVRQSGSIFTVIAGGPSDTHVAPPGYYMLFALDKNGVPSVAKIVKLG
jgi:hypothetical protein